MRISPQYGTKEKLFEMFNKINHLNENLSNSQEDKSEIIDNFIRYVGKKLNIDNKLPAISVNYKEGIAKENKSFGGYNPETETIEIIANKRNLADVLRTLAHEMVHHSTRTLDCDPRGCTRL